MNKELNIQSLVASLSSLKSSVNPVFHSKIESLNQDFFAETEKFIKTKKELDTIQDTLFTLLFSQLNLVVEELSKRNNQEKWKKREEEAKSQSEKVVKALKSTIKNQDKLIKDKVESERVLKMRIEGLESQIKKMRFKDKSTGATNSGVTKKKGILKLNYSNVSKKTEYSLKSYKNKAEPVCHRRNISLPSQPNASVWFDQDTPNRRLSYENSFVIF